MYPPFAGRQFSSFPLLAAQTADGKITFRISFSPRYNPNEAEREIVFFLPGSDDHSYVFIGITMKKFYICVKRKIKEQLVCSGGHNLKVFLSYLHFATQRALLGLVPVSVSYWWLVRVTLVVDWRFLPPKFWTGGGNL